MQAQMSHEGVTFSMSHSSGSGMQFVGSLDKASIVAQAPEVRVGGRIVRGELELEARSVPSFFRQTATQNPEMLRRLNQAYRTYLAAAGIVIAAPIAIELAVPIVVTAFRFAPQALASMGAAAAPALVR